MTRMRMYWGALFLISGTVALVFMVKFGVELERYYRLTAQIPSQVKDWKIQEISESKFILEAVYSFTIEGRTYGGRHLFFTTPFPNEFAAKDSLPYWEDKSWSVWYDRKHPSFSSLQKVFPLRSALHFILALVVFVYFFWLKMFTFKKYA